MSDHPRITVERYFYNAITLAADNSESDEPFPELLKRLEREGRLEIAQACFDFLPTRARLDIAGWPDHDIFSHS